MMIEPGHLMFVLGLLALSAPALRLAAPAAMRASSEAQAPAAVPALVQPERPVTHIERLEAIVTAAVDTARKAEDFHVSAHAQVDAADYALQGLRDELAAIMPAIAERAAHRRSPNRPVRVAISTPVAAPLAA